MGVARRTQFSSNLEASSVQSPEYDRRTPYRLQLESLRRQKVQLLQALACLIAVIYVAVSVASGFSSEVLIPFKPLPICLMLLMVLIVADGRAYGAWIARGLALGAMGNIILELELANVIPGAPLFPIGICCFLLGHCCYARAFLANSIVLSFFTAAPPLACAAIIFNMLQPSLSTEMKGLILIYATVIACTMVLAFARKPEGVAVQWSWSCASSGTIFFTVASTVLGYDRFVGSFPHGRQAATSIYYIAQYLIAMSTRGAQPRPLSKSHGSVENFAKGQSFRVDDEQ